VGFEEHIEEMFPQLESFTSSTTNFFVHPNVVASFLLVPLTSSLDLHVDVEFSNRK
jgi:hypothetical protein